MRWNWQLGDWPNFTWDRAKLGKAEALFREQAGVVIGASRHLDATERQTLTISLIRDEAVDSSAIEGETLDRTSVQSSIQKQLGLAADRQTIKPAEAGIAEMTVDLYERVSAPLTSTAVHRWHRLIMRGRRDLTDVGRYRTHSDPMQIVSGRSHAPELHFEAPPSPSVAKEMKLFWQGLEKNVSLPPITRAAIAHIWFESIHPYEDGNGRLGRAISEKLLAQGLRAPIVTGMASTLLKHRKAYYQALERASGTLEITDWILWFASKTLEAQQRTLHEVEFILHKSRMMKKLTHQLNPRQEKALLRLFAAGSQGFIGGLSAANYRRITGAPPATATRDLTGLVTLGGLQRTGDHKATRYYLNLPNDLSAPLEIRDIS